MMRFVKKHIKILGTRLKGGMTCKRMLRVQNERFHKLANAILYVKRNRFISDELKAIEHCESIRRDLLQNQLQISYEVFNNQNSRTVAQICKKASSPSVWAMLLYTLIKQANGPVNILELGANVGISGAYMISAAEKGSKLITMEGVPGLVKVASDSLNKVNKLLNKKIEYEIVEGLFEKTFDDTIKKLAHFDFVFIDGNHKYEPTINYFRKIADRTVKPCVFVFDDINWDDEMKQAWAEIRVDARSNFVVDLYRQGIVFYDPSEKGPSQHFDYHLAY